MPGEKTRSHLPPSTERARNCRPDAAAHGVGGEHLDEHHHRTDEGHAGEGTGAEPGDERGLDQPDGGLRQHCENVRCRQPGQGRHEGRFEQAPRATVMPGGPASRPAMSSSALSPETAMRPRAPALDHQEPVPEAT